MEYILIKDQKGKNVNQYIPQYPLVTVLGRPETQLSIGFREHHQQEADPICRQYH
jgi:hypothetical protein